MVKRTLWLFSFCLFVSPFAQAQQEQPPAPFTFKPGQSIYVIAVRHNTGMTDEIFEEIHKNSRASRGLASSTHVTPSSYPASDRRPTYSGGPPAGSSSGQSKRATLERTGPDRPTLDPETEPVLPLNQPTEVALYKAVVDAVRKQKQFKLVDTVEQADFVLFVQGEYMATLTQENYGKGNSHGSTTLFAGNPDLGEAPHGNHLIQIQGKAIPATHYRQAQANNRLADNLETVRWRGQITGRVLMYGGGFSTPPVESLIKKFQKEVLK